MSQTYDFGIYFGGSSLVIAYSRDGRYEVIVNEAGDRTTPAVVAVNNNETSIGLSAKQNVIRNAENTVLYGKYFLVNDSNLESNLKKKTYCQTKQDENTNEIVFCLEKNDREYKLKLSALIEYELKYLSDLAKTSLGIKENLNVVLSVPCYFTNEQSDILMNCAKNVGFNVQRIIRNPFAACLAYDIEEDNLRTNKILVYQMGSCSLELTLIDVVNGLYRKIASTNTFDINGDDFTDIIVNVLCDEFKRKNKQMDPKDNKRSLFKLKSSAEHLKAILSTMERAHCSIDALYEGLDFDYYLTRQRFEGACSKIYESCLTPIDEILKKNNLNHNQINKVILCGAATKMCKLQSLIRDKFPTDTTELLTQLSPDEVIALGCAKQATILTNSKLKKFTNDDTQFRCISNEIFMRIGNEGNKKSERTIFPLYAPIPIKRQINLNLEENLPFELLIYERTNERLLTKIELKEFTSRELNCLFQIKFDGTFEISLTEVSTNKTITEYLNSES